MFQSFRETVDDLQHGTGTLVQEGEMHYMIYGDGNLETNNHFHLSAKQFQTIMEKVKVELEEEYLDKDTQLQVKKYRGVKVKFDYD